MEKGRKHVFNPKIYPINLRIIFGADAEYLNDVFTNLDIPDGEEPIPFDDGYEATTALVGNVESGRKEVLVLFKNASDDIRDTAAHEAFHATFCYARCLRLYFDGYDPNNTEECLAYLNQWINSCISKSFSREDGKEGKMS